MPVVSRLFLLGSALAIVPGAAHADTINFDTYASGTSITTQYSGLTVSGGYITTPSGSSAPAHSGTNELTNAYGSPLTLKFAAGQSQISAFYTAQTSFGVTAYANGSSTAYSTTSFNSTGAQTSFLVSGINLTRIVITPYSSGFVTLDDLTYTAPAQTATTPEPASLLLFSTGLFATSLFPAWRSTRQKMLRTALASRMA